MINHMNSRMLILRQQPRQIHIHIFVVFQRPQNVKPPAGKQFAASLMKSLPQRWKTKGKTYNPTFLILQDRRQLQIRHLEILGNSPLYLFIRQWNEIENTFEDNEFYM